MLSLSLSLNLILQKIHPFNRDHSLPSIKKLRNKHKNVFCFVSRRSSIDLVFLFPGTIWILGSVDIDKALGEKVGQPNLAQPKKSDWGHAGPTPM